MCSTRAPVRVCEGSDRAHATTTRFAFVASTGRTATTFLAAALNQLPGVTALHEGQEPDDARAARLPLINVHNRQAWETSEAARSVVEERRDRETLSAAAAGDSLLVDVAFYNAPLLRHLAEVHPEAPLLVIVRRCEGFVRSATVVHGEDLQPAGWPDPAKELTDRERFIELGRLRPRRGAPESESWPNWSGIQRNIWLWSTINGHLLDCVRRLPTASMVRFEDLQAAPDRFWSTCLETLGLRSAANLEACRESSPGRVNARTAYHVGPLETWSGEERALYDQLARPLEDQIYE